MRCHIQMSWCDIPLQWDVTFKCHDVVSHYSGMSHSNVTTWYPTVVGCHIQMSQRGIPLTLKWLHWSVCFFQSDGAHSATSSHAGTPSLRCGTGRRAGNRLAASSESRRASATSTDPREAPRLSQRTTQPPVGKSWRQRTPSTALSFSRSSRRSWLRFHKSTQSSIYTPAPTCDIDVERVILYCKLGL